MTTARKTSTLTGQQDEGIKAQIEVGRRTNDSEAMRGVARREQERAAEVDAIRNALIEGESSGEPQPFDVQSFKRGMLIADARAPDA